MTKHSRFFVFTQKYWEKHSGANKSLPERNKELKTTWDDLSNEEKEPYREEARRLNTNGMPIHDKEKPKVKFHTRCAPNQLINVCDHVKKKKFLMEKLKRIWFDKLVEVSCPSVCRDYCAKLMHHFNPRTKVMCVRGTPTKITPERVHALLGIPYGGEKIDVQKINGGNSVFMDYKVVYGDVSYKRIGEMLCEMKGNEEDFEFLFVLYAFGVFLCPDSYVKVNNGVLKIMTLTADNVGGFDWASFVLDVLCKGIGKYLNVLKTGDDDTGKRNVDGCTYMLMVLGLQSYCLSNDQPPPDSDALSFWTQRRVLDMVALEKHNAGGLLCASGETSGVNTSGYVTELDFHLPVYREAYLEIMTMVGQKLMALEKRELQGTRVEIDEDKNEGEDDDVEEEHDEGDELDKEEGEEKEKLQEKEKKDQREEENKKADTVEEEYFSSEEPEKGEEEDVSSEEHEKERLKGPRRSTREKRPAIVSPFWAIPQRKAEKKRKTDEKERLFEFCTTRSNKVDGHAIFVDMHDFHLTRSEHTCLRSGGWISNSFMAMVVRTMIADQ